MQANTLYALTRSRGMVVLMVRGPLDEPTVRTFGAQLDEALAVAAPADHIRIDLRGVSECCGTAFMLLAIFGQRIAATGRAHTILHDGVATEDEAADEG